MEFAGNCPRCHHYIPNEIEMRRHIVQQHPNSNEMEEILQNAPQVNHSCHHIKIECRDWLRPTGCWKTRANATSCFGDLPTAWKRYCGTEGFLSDVLQLNSQIHVPFVFCEGLEIYGGKVDCGPDLSCSLFRNCIQIAEFFTAVAWWSRRYSFVFNTTTSATISSIAMTMNRMMTANPSRSPLVPFQDLNGKMPCYWTAISWGTERALKE